MVTTWVNLKDYSHVSLFKNQPLKVKIMKMYLGGCNICRSKIYEKNNARTRRREIVYYHLKVDCDKLKMYTICWKVTIIMTPKKLKIKSHKGDKMEL